MLTAQRAGRQKAAARRLSCYDYGVAKLYFRYGTMGSAKTLNLLAVAHTYELQKKKVLILKPELDKRFGAGSVKSRSGLEKEAHHLIRPDTKLLETLNFNELKCILVDESQFLSAKTIEELREIASHKDVPVICYGLRTDFQRRAFPGSLRLMELADSIDEVKSTCHYCNRKAVFNIRLVNGQKTLEGPQVLLGAEETYQPVCSVCY